MEMEWVGWWAITMVMRGGGLENMSHSHWDLINYYQKKNQAGKVNKSLRTESKDDDIFSSLKEVRWIVSFPVWVDEDLS